MVQQELPEPGRHVKGGEDGASGVPNVSNEYAGILHEVVGQSTVGIKGLEILYQADPPSFLATAKMGLLNLLSAGWMIRNFSQLAMFFSTSSR